MTPCPHPIFTPNVYGHTPCPTFPPEVGGTNILLPIVLAAMVVGMLICVILLAKTARSTQTWKDYEDGEDNPPRGFTKPPTEGAP